MSIRNLFFVFALFSLLSIISLACGGNESEEENYDRGQTRDFKPPPSAHYGESGSKVSPAGTEGGNKFFDPSAKKETTEGKLSSKLDAKCEFDASSMSVSCVAQRTSMKSTLNWSANLSDTEASGQKKGIFEFQISDSDAKEVLVTLEECLNTACNESETTVGLTQ